MSCSLVNSTLMPGTELRFLGFRNSRLYAAFHNIGACVTITVSSTSEMMPTFALEGMVNRLAETSGRPFTR